MVKIKVCDLDPRNACSYYRSMGVLPKLENVIVKHAENISWHVLSNIDVLYLERPYDNNYLQSIEYAKDFGIKVWVDYDDCFHDIPKWSPAYGLTNFKKNIEKCLSLADVVTVTTEKLKESYGKYNKNIFVVENAFNDYNYKFEKVNQIRPIINWRGSKTHRNDLLSCSKEMIELSKKYKSWTWNFIGEDIWYITENIENSKQLNEMDIVSYNKLIKNLNPAIQIIPLEYNNFNLSKSNIAFIEGTYSGAACVAPNMPEFNKPGISNYGETGSFCEKIERFILDEKYRYRQYEKSYNYIKNNLMLSKINKKREKIINEIL